MARRRSIGYGLLGLFGVWLMALLWLPGPALATVTVDADVSPSQVGVGEPIEYRITVAGAGRGVDPPVLAEMADVRVAGSGSSSMFQSINGQISRRKVFTYTLIADTPGVLTIPPATVTVQGTDYHTASVSVTVLPVSNRSRAQGPAPGGVFDPRARGAMGEGVVTIDNTVDIDTPYVGQQVILTFSFDRAVELSRVSYTPAETTGFLSFDLNFPPGGDKHAYYKDGRRRIVQERKVALFPIRPGEAGIGPASLDFSISPFSGSQRLMTRPITVTVRPLPTAGRPDDFSGLVGEAEMSVSLSESKARVGQALTLTVSVTGRGNLHDLTPPEVPGSADFDVYDPEVSEAVSHGLNGVAGAIHFNYVLIPRRAGQMTLPALSLSLFDPKAGAYRRLHSDPLVVSVTAAPSPAPAPFPAPAATDTSGAADTGGPSAPAPSAPPRRSLGDNLFGWLQGLVLLLVLLLIRRWYRRRQRLVEPVDVSAPSAPAHTAQPALDRADILAALDAAAAEPDDAVSLKKLSRAVKGHMAAHFDVTVAQVERDLVAERLEADEALCQDALDLLAALDLARFAPGAAALRRDDLTDHARRVVTALGDSQPNRRPARD